MEACPTCGQMFTRLWQHKCKGPISSSSQMHKSQPSQSTPEQQMCPTCGQMFKRLWQHKCKGPTTNSSSHGTHQFQPSPSTPEEQMCPTCGQMFKRLWQHKCKGISPAFSDVENAKKVSKEEMCLTCGQMFKQLSRHKCKGSTASTYEHSAPVSAVEPIKQTSEQQMCLKCGQMFRQLSRHKCKEVIPPSSVPDKETKSSQQVPENQTCQTCGQVFKQLWRHKCKGPIPVSVQSSVLPEKAGSSSSQRATEEQMCSMCGQTFKQLSRHKCKGLPFSLPRPSDSSYDVESKEVPNEQCSTCGQLFKQLWRHKCKGPVVTKSSPLSASADVKNTESPKTASEKQMCPVCGEMFKQLRQHKCKGKTTGSHSSPEKVKLVQGPRGFQPTLDTRSLDKEAEQVMEALGIQVAPNPKGEAIEFFQQEVKLKQEEKDKVTHAFNPFRRRVVQGLHECTGWEWTPLNSGSSYDGTKVTRADEVDCMLIPKFPRDWLSVEYTEAPPGFCFVKLKTLPCENDHDRVLWDDLKALCDRNGFVSSRKFREKVFEGFKYVVEDERRVKVDPDAKAGCPSFAVLLDAGCQREVSIDLVPALHLDGLPPGAKHNLQGIPEKEVQSIKEAGFDIIPKECSKVESRNVRQLLWRLSFSRAEKLVTKYADRRCHEGGGAGDPERKSPLTVRKQVLRMFKRILEIIKGFDNSREKKPNPKLLDLQRAADYLRKKMRRNVKIEKFTTFQVRTLLWTEFYVTCPGNEKWVTSNFRQRLAHVLIQLKKMVTGQTSVPHFFIPEMDIMAEVPRHEREFLYIMFCIVEKLF